MEPVVPDGPWVVLVEENAGAWGGEGSTWQISQIVLVNPGDDVRDVARSLAHHYKPGKPMSPKRRSVFKINDYAWLVRVIGATSSQWMFKVTAARHVAELDS